MRLQLRATLAAVICAAACAAASSSLLEADPVPAHNVVMTATNVAHTTHGDSVVIQFQNAGTATAYLARCGSTPLLLEQHVTNGAWAGGVQNFMCPAPAAPGPIELAPGATLTVTRVFDVAGRHRMLASVGTTQAMTDAVTAYSNPFDVSQ